jgi:hypothetical protein
MLGGILLCALGLLFAAGASYADDQSVTTDPVLVGHVNWQGIPQPNTRNTSVYLTLTLKLDNVEVNFPPQTTDASGFFTVSVSGLPSGTYQWRLCNPNTWTGFLANTGTVTLAGDPQTNFDANTYAYQVCGPFGCVRGGDTNNDNMVNVLDFNILKNSFGQGGRVRGDVNYDILANTIDFSIIKGNFGSIGAPSLGVLGR